MNIRRVFTTAAALVFSAGLFAACGGGGGNSDTASGDTASSGTALTVNATDFKFDPTTLTAKAGEAVTFTIKNDGKVTHNLTIEDLKVDQDVKDGKTASQTVTPKAGSFEYHCNYHPASMKGTLTVS
ncbi:MAG: cupredoxin domain-containing protein [Actinobacteria bacterium]|nr:cupredoxin domain-containing protein [Actinomycetota bacterium]